MSLESFGHADFCGWMRFCVLWELRASRVTAGKWAATPGRALWSFTVIFMRIPDPEGPVASLLRQKTQATVGSLWFSGKRKLCITLTWIYLYCICVWVTKPQFYSRQSGFCLTSGTGWLLLNVGFFLFCSRLSCVPVRFIRGQWRLRYWLPGASSPHTEVLLLQRNTQGLRPAPRPDQVWRWFTHCFYTVSKNESQWILRGLFLIHWWLLALFAVDRLLYGTTKAHKDMVHHNQDDYNRQGELILMCVVHLLC